MLQSDLKSGCHGIMPQDIHVIKMNKSNKTRIVRGSDYSPTAALFLL